jgi:hypothetical protein
MSGPKPCKDCRFATIEPGEERHFRSAAFCSHASAVWEETDPVHGERSNGSLPCWKARWTSPVGVDQTASSGSHATAWGLCNGLELTRCAWTDRVGATATTSGDA